MHRYVQLSNSVQVREIIHHRLIYSILWGNTRTASAHQVSVSVIALLASLHASIIHYQQKIKN